MSKKSWTYMAGTEGTGQYVVVAQTRNRGRVGVRLDEARGVYRIRIEPANRKATLVMAGSFPTPTWKQPGDGGENRFSRTVSKDAKSTVDIIVRVAVTALLVGGGKVRVNKNAPDNLRAAVHEALVREVRDRNVAGCNLAPRWTLDTLIRKVNGGLSLHEARKLKTDILRDLR